MQEMVKKSGDTGEYGSRNDSGKDRRDASRRYFTMEDQEEVSTVEEVRAELGLTPDAPAEPEGETVTDEPAAEQDQGEAETQEEGQTEEEKKFYKLNARERVQQAVNQAREAKQELEAERQRIAALERQLQAVEQRTTRPNPLFTPPEELDHQRLNAWFAEKRDIVETMRLEGNILQAELVEDEIINMRRAYQENLKQAQQWHQQRQQEAQARHIRESQATEVTTRLQRASDLVRQSYNVDPQAWDEGGKLFVEMMQKDPTLQAEFFERERLQGPVATVKWIYGMVGQSMGQAAVQAKQKRETGKTQSFGGSQGGTDNSTQQSKVWNLPRADFEKMIAQAKGLRT